VIEMKDWRDDLVFEFDEPLYISFDLDGLDPAFAPGVSAKLAQVFSGAPKKPRIPRRDARPNRRIRRLPHRVDSLH